MRGIHSSSLSTQYPFFIIIIIRSESEIEFGLGLESSILDVISSSCYKENDKDFTNESITTIDDSISALTGANVSNSTYNHYEESEFSSLLLIDKILLGSSR